MSLETRFDATLAAQLALPEKQIQQNYRPVIGIHKWFARRPGSLFRHLLIAEFDGDRNLSDEYWRAHSFRGTIADPFMGGGTPLIEANRLGFHVIGTDVNPMAFWIVRQALGELDLAEFKRWANIVSDEVEAEIGSLYVTRCRECSEMAAVKYFIWVKTQPCPECGVVNDLFPGHMLAENVRHPRFVVHCGSCQALVEVEHLPTDDRPVPCSACGDSLAAAGSARRNQMHCRCGQTFRYPDPTIPGGPKHRLWAMEYHCAACKPGHKGRFFKAPDPEDLKRLADAENAWAKLGSELPIPQAEIPAGDETTRLHRWGYKYYREMFTTRQLLGLGILLRRIQAVPATSVRHALLTVFSDSLRYQNILCRYDTMALKCQDIFSVHGFPVGLVQCENSLLGLPGVGSGGFRHFVEKYIRAKAYCEAPFETKPLARGKEIVRVAGERIGADLVDSQPAGETKQAYLQAAPADTVRLLANSLDGVFTDPPYFNNVQYAELMDFCFVWLREALAGEIPAFERSTTRTDDELTGNVTANRGLEHFTQGLSRVFTRFAAALKPGAPFVFTYHHNQLHAYAPLVVAILDAGLVCTESLPAAAEMEASLHIARTGSSVLDSVIVCRQAAHISERPVVGIGFRERLTSDCRNVARGGVRVSVGDIRCLALGHIARQVIGTEIDGWDRAASTVSKLELAERRLREVAGDVAFATLPTLILQDLADEAISTTKASPDPQGTFELGIAIPA